MSFSARLVNRQILLGVAVLFKQGVALKSMLHGSPQVIMLHHIAHDVLAPSLFPFSLHVTCDRQVVRHILAIDVGGALEGFLPKPDLG